MVIFADLSKVLHALLNAPINPKQHSRTSQILFLLLTSRAIFLLIRFQRILSHTGISPSDTADQLANEAALIGTPCPTFLAQHLILHPANMIKSNRTLHYISHLSDSRHNSIQHSPPSHPWLHNQSLPASLLSVIYRFCFRHTHFPAHLIRFGLPPSPPFHLSNRITRTVPIPLFIFLSPPPLISTKTIA